MDVKKYIALGEEKEEHKLPTFMRNKIEEEQRIEEERRKRENPIIKEGDIV